MSKSKTNQREVVNQYTFGQHLWQHNPWENLVVSNVRKVNQFSQIKKKKILKFFTKIKVVIYYNVKALDKNMLQYRKKMLGEMKID